MRISDWSSDVCSSDLREIVTDQNFKSMRNAMVESQLRTSDVNDPSVIAAMARVPREAFLPTERQALAYIDRPVQLSAGRSLNTHQATGGLVTEVMGRASWGERDSTYV